MSIFWSTNRKLNTTILPRTLLRPFWHPEYLILNDSTYTTKLPYNKPQLSGLLLLISSLLLLAYSCIEIYIYLNIHNEKGIRAETFIADNALNVLAVITSLILLLIIKRALSTRTISFKRATHELNYPCKSFFPKYSQSNFDNFSGLISHQKNLTGKRRAHLVLKHNESGDEIIIATVYDNQQALAGYWSFIVQYMKPSAPLPRVPALADFSHTTQGIIHEKTIDYT